MELGPKRMGSWPLKTAGPEHASAGNCWTSWLIEAISANQISEAKRLCYKWELETSFTWIMKVRRLVSQLRPETLSMPVEVSARYFGRSVTNGDRCRSLSDLCCHFSCLHNSWQTLSRQWGSNCVIQSYINIAFVVCSVTQQFGQVFTWLFRRVIPDLLNVLLRVY